MNVREYPIVSFWYTRHKGRTIEWIIDHDIDYMIWAIKSFQDLTPSQAEYLKKRTGKELKPEYIQDVQPYEWQKGDPVSLYAELCETRDLEGTLSKYRTKYKENNLFSAITSE